LGDWKPGLFGKPVLVVGFAPAGEVVLIEESAGFAKFGDDVGIGKTILKHEVNLFTDRRWEMGDSAGAAAVEDVTGGAVEGIDQADFIREYVFVGVRRCR
jgi:hypothetical protein